MASIQTIEEQTLAEFGKVIGTIKNNAVLSVIAALIVGGVLGKFF